jgi:hypothetical protein
MQRTLHRLLPRFSERLPLRAGKRQNVRPFLWRFMGVIIFTNEDNAKTPPKRLQKRLITGSKDYCGTRWGLGVAVPCLERRERGFAVTTA